MTLYVILKFVHVLLAIVALGFNASYAIWLARIGRDPEHALHVLRGIKMLDDRFANPAYGLLLITGLALLGVGQIPFTTFWIAAALVLYVVLLVVAVAVYSPTLKRQIAVVESGGTGSEEYHRLSNRTRNVGIALVIVVVVIEFLMVTKPVL